MLQFKCLFSQKHSQLCIPGLSAESRKKNPHVIPSHIQQIQHFQSNQTDFDRILFFLKVFQNNQTQRQQFSKKILQDKPRLPLIVISPKEA